MPRSDISGYVFVPPGTLLLDLLRSFPLGVSGPKLVLYQWVAGGLLLSAMGILFAPPRGASRRNAIYLLLCLVVPLGEIYAISFARPVYMNIRHVMFASPFYYLLLAAGVAQARRVRVGRWARTAIGVAVGSAVAMLLIGMGLSTYTYFADPLYDKEDHRRWGRYLTEHVRPGDVVFVYPGAVYELYTYYASPSVPYYGIPMPGANTEQTVRQLVEIGQNYDRVWIAHSMTPGWAYDGNAILQWLDENAVRVASARFSGHLNTFPVYAFSLEPPVTSSVPEEARTLALEFGGQLELLGLSSVTEPVRAGDPLLLSLYWSAAQPLDRDYRFTISLNDAKGRSWASLDYVPYGDSYPLARWPVDGMVRDDVDIDVPPGTPPGRYWVHVSVYPADRSDPALAARELGSGRLLGLIVPISEIEVARPDAPPPEADVAIEHRTRRRYGDLVLLGYDYRGSTYQPGDTIKLDTYWRALRASQQDLVFSLQLVDAAGDVWAARQIPPSDGYPTSRWLEGELVRGKHRFRVPLGVPEGDYTLRLTPVEDSLSSTIWPWRGRPARLARVSIGSADAERVFEVPPMQHELRAILDDQVELLGYDLGESTVQAGQVVSCTFYWRGLQEMNVNYTVFTHLIAPDGTTWGQWDNQPQQGRAPTTRWVPGQVITDSYQIPLSGAAQTGPLSLRVGMYDLLTMTRLPVLDGNGTITGDSITVAEIEIVESTE